MSDLFGKRKTIFDVLNEAPEDGGAETTDNAGAEDTAPAEDTGNETNDEANTDDTTSENDNTDDDMGNDEDFDVDTTISDDDTGASDTDMDSTDDMGDSGSVDGDNTEEVNPKNTDIFSTLSKEEQAIKIEELKKLYNELYIYVSDMLGKIDDITPDEDTVESVYRITSGLYDLKKNIGDYIKNIFPIKSYIENDIAYNRYLTIIQSITNVINLVASEMEEKVQKDNKK
jgi:hypothetical protein